MKLTHHLPVALGTLALAAVVLAAAAQWQDDYSAGLGAAKAANWPMARQSFQKAGQDRKGDVAESSRLPGPITEPKVWRGGAPYSPNFAAAYSGYRWALETTDTAERNRLLESVASELEGILRANQHTPEAYFVLSQTLVLLRSDARFEAMNEGWRKQGKFNFKVDTEFMTAEDREVSEIQKNDLLAMSTGPVSPNPGSPNPGSPANTVPVQPDPSVKPTANQDPTAAQNPTVPPAANGNKAGQKPPKRGDRQAPGAADSGTGRPSEKPEKPAVQSGPNPITQEIKAEDLTQSVPSMAGEVPVVPSKYALLIGNSENAFSDGKVPFAVNSANSLKDSLTKFGGYSAENVQVLTNASSEQVRSAAQAMAEKLPESATVFLYFCGLGSNVGGVDYLAGTDATDPFQTGSMIRKDEILRVFTAKGARVFCFFECSRPVQSGRSFGSEAPTAGAVSQMLGTLEGRTINSVFDGGQEIGIFTLGLKRVLEQFRSNSIPLAEFGWQVFYAMRGGKTAGGGIQTPTLPSVTLLEQDARF